MTAPFVTVGRGKAALLRHLMQMHGVVYPDSPAMWSEDELLAAHRNGHGEGYGVGVLNVAHVHQATKAAA